MSLSDVFIFSSSSLRLVIFLLRASAEIVLVAVFVVVLESDFEELAVDAFFEASCACFAKAEIIPLYVFSDSASGLTAISAGTFACFVTDSAKALGFEIFGSTSILEGSLFKELSFGIFPSSIGTLIGFSAILV